MGLLYKYEKQQIKMNKNESIIKAVDILNEGGHSITTSTLQGLLEPPVISAISQDEFLSKELKSFDYVPSDFNETNLDITPDLALDIIFKLEALLNKPNNGYTNKQNMKEAYNNAITILNHYTVKTVSQLKIK